MASLVESISLLQNFFAYVSLAHFFGTVFVYAKIYFVARNPCPSKDCAKLKGQNLTCTMNQSKGLTNQESTSQKFILNKRLSKSSSGEKKL